MFLLFAGSVRHSALHGSGNFFLLHWVQNNSLYIPLMLWATFFLYVAMLLFVATLLIIMVRLLALRRGWCVKAYMGLLGFQLLPFVYLGIMES